MKTRNALLSTTALVLGAGCVTPRSAPPESAVFCSKCEMVWIEATDFDDPYRLSAVPAQVMRCPDCESAVVHFFKTGELSGHACTSCGGDLVHCGSPEG